MREIKIVGADHTPIETTLLNWSCSVNGKEPKDIKWYMDKAAEDKNTIEDKNEEEELIKLFISYYKAIAQDIENELGDNTNKLEVIGHQAEAKEIDAGKYSLYSDFQGGQYGNLVGSVRKKYTEEEFKEICKCFSERKKNIGKRFKKICNAFFKDNNEVIVTIEIVSRFDLIDNIQKKPGKPYFLLTMLTCGQLRFNNLQISENMDDELFDCLLIWKLKNHLLYAYQKGVYQTYHTFEENGDRFKGTIDFSRHIRLNMGMDNGRIAYCYREKTVDNYLNHLILAAYERLRDDYPGLVADNLDNDNDISQVIALLMMETDFHKYTVGELINRCSMPITHPFYSEYENLRKTCLSILRNEGVSIMGGQSDANVSGVLYYIPDLWEEYLERIIRGNGMDVNCQKSTRIVSNDTISRPDFLLKCKDGYYMILDAKFKKKWKDVYFQTFTLEKYGEDYNKCIRDMEALSMHAAGIIFPYNDNGGKNGSLLPRRYSVCASGNKKDLFYIIPIKVPNAPEASKTPNTKSSSDFGYIEWKDSFDKSVKSQMEALENIAEYEREFFESEKELEDILEKLSGMDELDIKEKNELKEVLNNRKARKKIIDDAAEKPVEIYRKDFTR